METKFSKEISLSLKSDEAKNLLTLPSCEGLSKTYFLDLRLFDKKGKQVNSNFYTLSTVPDVLDTAKTNWFVTPVKSHADFTMLNDLKKVEPEVKHSFKYSGDKVYVHVTIKNASDLLAFMADLSVLKGKSGESVLPVFWQDNYFSLLPHETKNIEGYFYKTDLKGTVPCLKIGGWNIIQNKY
jgi:exo-1,4-beta-D-glucosaminidase